MLEDENLQEIEKEEKKDYSKKEKKFEHKNEVAENVEIEDTKYMFKPCGNRKVKLSYDEKLFNENKVNGWTL